MKILFKATSELAKYAGIDVNTDINTLKPYIYQAQQLFIEDEIIGKDLFQELLSDYTDNYEENVETDPDDDDKSGMNDNLELLLPYVQQALTYYALYQAVTQLGVNFGDVGLVEQSGQGSNPVPKWKVDAVRNDYISNADRFAEKLLEFLESNATDSIYSTWFGSAYDTRAEGLIVATVRVADKYVDINTSRRIFRKMIKRIREVERVHVKKLICVEQYNELVTNIQSEALTSTQIALVEMLEPYICKLALYLTVPGLRLQLTDQGINISSANDGTVMKASANASEVGNFMRYLKDGNGDLTGYEHHRQAVTDFIEENISDYPLIEDSTCYTSKADPGPTHMVTNSKSNNWFGA